MSNSISRKQKNPPPDSREWLLWHAGLDGNAERWQIYFHLHEHVGMLHNTGPDTEPSADKCQQPSRSSSQGQPWRFSSLDQSCVASHCHSICYPIEHIKALTQYNNNTCSQLSKCSCAYKCCIIYIKKVFWKLKVMLARLLQVTESFQENTNSQDDFNAYFSYFWKQFMRLICKD